MKIKRFGRAKITTRATTTKPIRWNIRKKTDRFVDDIKVYAPFTYIKTRIDRHSFDMHENGVRIDTFFLSLFWGTWETKYTCEIYQRQQQQSQTKRFEKNVNTVVRCWSTTTQTYRTHFINLFFLLFWNFIFERVICAPCLTHNFMAMPKAKENTQQQKSLCCFFFFASEMKAKPKSFWYIGMDAKLCVSMHAHETEM